MFHPKRIALLFVLLTLLTLNLSDAKPAEAQLDCTLPATVTTADQLYDCITAANAGSGETITLGADIDLTTLTTSPLPQITSAITLEGAGYAIDGGDSVQIFNVSETGDFSVNQATLQNGSAVDGGGIYNSGTLTVTNSTISGNTANKGGGGIHNLNSGTMTVTNSTISSNTAGVFGGGGIENFGDLTATNNTFSDNATSGSGGGIINYGDVTATSNTFSGNSATNSGGGLYNSSGTVHLAGNIFAVGTSGENCANSGGTSNDNGYNLSDDGTCTNGGTGSATNVTLNLGPLADNGGPTLTHLPTYSSDAIGVIPNGATISNSGTSWTCNQTFTDQRGQSRPLNSGDACTAGAVEVVPLCPSWTAATADELYKCITEANVNGAVLDTITLGADIDLTTLTTSPLPQITSEIKVEGAGYAIDGGNSVQIFNIGGTGDFTVSQATLQNGRSGGNGGAIINNGALTVNNSTIVGNTTQYSGGAISNSGVLTVTNCMLSSNTATIANGGAISNSGGTLTVTNSTFSGNSAGSSGGAIQNFQSQLTITNSTFFENSASRGGAIDGEYGDSTFNLAGNIFVAGASGDNCANGGTINDNGYNLSDDATCTNGGPGSLTNATLNLGALADNGGPTLTHLPGAGSDAIGAIPNGTTISNNGTSWTCDDVDTFTDQRGEQRPINTATDCTAGAVEVAMPPLCPTWTATTADELYDCITLANANESPSPTADTITLGAVINLTTLTASPLPQITSEITLEGAGNAIDGGNSMQIFYVAETGDFTVNQATLQHGKATLGGGIRNNGTLMITGSTLSGNTASDGGGIWNDYTRTATVINSTFSNNSAGNGVAIYNDNGTVTATNSTFSGNSGYSGIYNEGTLHFAGNIFFGGASGLNCGNSETLNDNGYNLSDDDTCIDGGTGSLTNATLNLGALADNGGLTLTHLPGSGSDAIGAIPNGTTISNNGTSWTCDDVDTFTDQRGESRPINTATDCTAGAVEVAMPPICTSWTATTADELYDCLTLANANESPSPTADTITLGADIDLTTLTTSPLPQITSEIALEGAGYAIDGGWDGVTGMRIFDVTATGDFTVNQATLQNGFTDSGGGIRNHGTLAVTNSTFTGNSIADGGGGIYSSGTVTVSNSTFFDNWGNGGGIYNNGTATVSNSTFSGNAGHYGGGIYSNYGTLKVTNCTISGNSATSYGGGIYNYEGAVTLTNNTFSGNSDTNDWGGGIYNNGTLNLAGNIFAAGASGDNCYLYSGTLNDNGYNLSDDATCTNGGTGSATNATLNLGALADNGGLTLTHLPGDASDAISAIPNGTTISNNGTTWTCDDVDTFTDQRGESRPLNSGDDCTAGAVEAKAEYKIFLPLISRWWP